LRHALELQVEMSAILQHLNGPSLRLALARTVRRPSANIASVESGPDSLRESGDPDFHQLEPDVELVAADRSSQAGSIGAGELSLKGSVLSSPQRLD
jgi:hypothetical protein